MASISALIISRETLAGARKLAGSGWGGWEAEVRMGRVGGRGQDGWPAGLGLGWGSERRGGVGRR